MAQKNLLEKEQEVLLTNEGWLVSRYFGNALNIVKEVNRIEKG